MRSHMMRVEIDELELTARIEAALDGQECADIGIAIPDYRLAAHAFANYIEACCERGGVPDRVRACGHLFFALCGYRPAADEDAGRLFTELSVTLRRVGMLATEAAWAYMREQARKAEKVRVQ
jgi:hypothetical protein